MGLLRDICRKLAPGPANEAGFRPDFERSRANEAPPCTLGNGEFFESESQLRANVAEVLAKHPAWVARNRDYVEQRCRDGLPVYDQVWAPLDGNFDWCGQRDQNDILYECRPHRFAFAPKLALASVYGQGELEILQGVLAGWIEAVDNNEDCAAYFSSLVVAQRLVALSWTLHFLQASPEPEARRRQVTTLLNRIIAEDCRYLEQVTGTAYPNNHLLLEYFAGWYASLLFPTFFQGAEAFRRRCREGLDQQIVRQICADGSGFEQASHYSEMATEAVVAYSLLAARNGLRLAPEISERLRAAIDFQAAAIAGPGASLHLGNATEDPLFPLDPGDSWMGAGWQLLARELLGEPVTVTGEATGLERAFWLLGGYEFETQSVDAPEPLPHLRHWPDAGLTLFRHGPAGGQLVFRSGPGHSPYVPGHMHFDWLGIYLTDATRAWIPDAGTYTYRAKPAASGIWKQYFVGAAAHNGIVLHGEENLPTQRGDFPASLPECRVATHKPVAGARVAAISATIEGSSPYAGIERGVISIPGAGWLVWQDIPETASGKLPGAPLQFAPDIECGNGAASVRRPDGDSDHLDILVSDNMQRLTTQKGSTAPVAGWVSPAYGRKTPAPRMQWRLAPGLSAMLLAFRDQGQPAQALKCVSGEGFLHFVVDRGPHELHLYLGRDGNTMADDMLESEARLIMLEKRGGSLHRLLQVGAGQSEFHDGDLAFTLDPGKETAGLSAKDSRCRATRINAQEVEVFVNA